MYGKGGGRFMSDWLFEGESREATSPLPYVGREAAARNLSRGDAVMPVGAVPRLPRARSARALEGLEEQVRTPADAVLHEQVRDVELRGALGHLEAPRDLLVRQIVEHGLEDLTLAAGEPLDAA